MRRVMFALLLGLGLSACSSLPESGPRRLDFTAGPAGKAIDPATLLERGIVPTDKLLSVAEALARAPEGSVLLPCWREWSRTSFWGVCSHLARKLGPGQMADQPNLFQRAGVRSTDTLKGRYAVIVLDVGVRPAQLTALKAEVKHLDGQMYSFSRAPDTSDCSTYQNALQHALNLPDVVPFNAAWNTWLPADALKMPGVKVLWVGVNQY